MDLLVAFQRNLRQRRPPRPTQATFLSQSSKETPLTYGGVQKRHGRIGLIDQAHISMTSLPCVLLPQHLPTQTSRVYGRSLGHYWLFALPADSSTSFKGQTSTRNKDDAVSRDQPHQFLTGCMIGETSGSAPQADCYIRFTGQRWAATLCDFSAFRLDSI